MPEPACFMPRLITLATEPRSSTEPLGFARAMSAVASHSWINSPGRVTPFVSIIKAVARTIAVTPAAAATAAAACSTAK